MRTTSAILSTKLWLLGIVPCPAEWPDKLTCFTAECVSKRKSWTNDDAGCFNLVLALTFVSYVSFCFPPAELNRLRSSTTEDSREPARSWRPKDMACWFAQLTRQLKWFWRQRKSACVCYIVNRKARIMDEPLKNCEYVLQDKLFLLKEQHLASLQVWFWSCICFISLNYGTKREICSQTVHKQSFPSQNKQKLFLKSLSV